MTTMYNRYIPNGGGYTRVSIEDGAELGAQTSNRPPEGNAASGQGHSTKTASTNQGRDPLHTGIPFPNFSLKGMEELGGLSSILKAMKLDNLDSGDILLLLIILLLLVEGDHMELVIALGLVLIMGLGDDEDDE